MAPIVPAAAAPEPEAAPAAVPLLDQLDLSDVVVIDDQAGQGAGLESLSSTAPVARRAAAASAGSRCQHGPDCARYEWNSALLSPDTEVIFELPVPEAAPAGATLAGPSVDLPASSVEVSSVEAAPQGGAVSEPEETISVDFPDEDVRTILRTVADLFDLNLVIPDALQGRTSVKLRKITWQQVFEVVLEPLGFTYLVDRNIIRIKSIAELTTEPVDTRIFVVERARAGDLLSSIQPLVDASAGGRIQVDARNNVLVVSERPSKLTEIQQLIGSLDKATRQVMIETKFIEVTNMDQKNIGINWSSLDGFGVSAGPFRREWQRQGTKNEQTTDSSSNSSGLSIPGGFSSDDTLSSAEDLMNVSNINTIDTAVFSADRFAILISALEQSNDSKLVANPTVVTMNSQTAKIDIVTEYPQVAFSFNPETGTREADGLSEPLRVGTQVEVTPTITGEYIDLNVRPTVSNVVGTTETEVGPQPIISRREAQTNVIIKDRHTLAIGGLIQNELVESGTSVPVLGSLPYIGRLFSSKSNKEEQKNLTIFITAKTLNDTPGNDQESYRESVDPRVLHQMGIVPADVPGYSIPAEDVSTFKALEDIRAVVHRNEAMLKNRKMLKAIQQFEADAQEPADEVSETVLRGSNAQ